MRINAVGCWFELHPPGRAMLGSTVRSTSAMSASYRNDGIQSTDALCKTGSDRLGTSLFKSEANCGAVHLMITGGTEPLLLFFGEYLVEPILAKASDRPADAFYAARMDTPSPKII